MLVVSIFFFLIPHAFSLSFSFTSFQDDGRISLEKSARLIKTSIELANGRNNESVGRATYHQPMHLWDKATGKLTDFTTNFTFVIDSMGQDTFGDGIAFFLAPADSKLPVISNVGGAAMGLIIGGQETILNSKDHPFVAVEFDIYPNTKPNEGWDPPYVHVGVDINSIQSDAIAGWNAANSIVLGQTNVALISYNASTHMFSISFTYGFDSSKNLLWQHIQHVADLTKYLPEWVTFGFSAATGDSTSTHRINTWSFYSEDFSNVTPTRVSRNSIALALGFAVGGFVFVCGVGFVLWKNKKKMEDNDPDDNMSDEDFDRTTGPKKYSHAELASASNNFKYDQKLGQGGFGCVYKGFLKDSNSYVAIKKISKSSIQGKKEFASEVRIISQLRHRNVVQLMGWCHEKKELLLVYEYMPNGSLDSHLFKDKILLRWPIRFKIALDLASALLYLHEEWEQCVVHRDIKSSNIMLDSKFNAKLGDFGLARIADHTKGAQTTALAGTVGYMAPECLTAGRATKESDVYSFGVVALEIACGRKSINHKAAENEISLVNWVWKLYGSGKLLEVVDSKLDGDFDNDQIKCLMTIGLWCAHPNHSDRPSIRKVIQVLNFEAPCPNLPSSYPIPTYNEFPRGSSFSIQSMTNTLER